jgi:MOSC domain-containing protein YiiM
MVHRLGSCHYWETYLRRSDFVYGNFGENLTVEGRRVMKSASATGSDRWRNLRSQPASRHLLQSGHTSKPRDAGAVGVVSTAGFYSRVIREGEVGAGDRIEKIAEGPEQMTGAEINALLYFG